MTRMSDVAIPFGAHVLLLTTEQFNEALRRGKELLPQPTAHTPASNEVLDADGMAKRTGIPASWFLEQARQNEVPHIRAGKYVRFRPQEVLDALKVEGRRKIHDLHADQRTVDPFINRKVLNGRR